MSDAESVGDILDSVWDTRDLVELIDRLEGELSDLTCDECGGELDGERCSSAQDDRADDDAGHKNDEAEDIATRLTEAKALADECEDFADYRYGVTVIRDDYFEDYARQLADDIGSVPAEGWPGSYIDWTAATEALQQDYTSFDFAGETWWAR